VRNPNIQLLQLYDNKVPNLRHFFFIKDTEELCFVEENGQTRVFNIISRQFEADCKLPPNTANVLSTPGGSCIVAFVKSKDNNDKNNERQNNSKIKEIYVYFRKNFGEPITIGLLIFFFLHIYKLNIKKKIFFGPSFFIS